MKDPRGVAGPLSDIGHCGVLPEAELVLVEAVGAEEAHLGVGVNNGVEEGADVGVPELDRAVGCASTCRQEVL